jgi:hypothetical protein
MESENFVVMTSGRHIGSVDAHRCSLRDDDLLYYCCFSPKFGQERRNGARYGPFVFIAENDHAYSRFDV